MGECTLPRTFTYRAWPYSVHCPFSLKKVVTDNPQVPILVNEYVKFTVVLFNVPQLLFNDAMPKVKKISISFLRNADKSWKKQQGVCVHFINLSECDLVFFCLVVFLILNICVLFNY